LPSRESQVLKIRSDCADRVVKGGISQASRGEMKAGTSQFPNGYGGFALGISWGVHLPGDLVRKNRKSIRFGEVKGPSVDVLLMKGDGKKVVGFPEGWSISLGWPGPKRIITYQGSTSNKNGAAANEKAARPVASGGRPR